MQPENAPPVEQLKSVAEGLFRNIEGGLLEPPRFLQDAATLHQAGWVEGTPILPLLQAVAKRDGRKLAPAFNDRLNAHNGTMALEADFNLARTLGLLTENDVNALRKKFKVPEQPNADQVGALFGQIRQKLRENSFAYVTDEEQQIRDLLRLVGETEVDSSSSIYDNLGGISRDDPELLPTLFSHGSAALQTALANYQQARDFHTRQILDSSIDREAGIVLNPDREEQQSYNEARDNLRSLIRRDEATMADLADAFIKRNQAEVALIRKQNSVREERERFFNSLAEQANIQIIEIDKSFFWIRKDEKLPLALAARTQAEAAYAQVRQEVRSENFSYYTHLKPLESRMSETLSLRPEAGSQTVEDEEARKTEWEWYSLANYFQSGYGTPLDRQPALWERLFASAPAGLREAFNAFRQASVDHSLDHYDEDRKNFLVLVEAHAGIGAEEAEAANAKSSLADLSRQRLFQLLKVDPPVPLEMAAKYLAASNQAQITSLRAGNGILAKKAGFWERPAEAAGIKIIKVGYDKVLYIDRHPGSYKKLTPEIARQLDSLLAQFKQSGAGRERITEVLNSGLPEEDRGMSEAEKERWLVPEFDVYFSKKEGQNELWEGLFARAPAGLQEAFRSYRDSGWDNEGSFNKLLDQYSGIDVTAKTANDKKRDEFSNAQGLLDAVLWEGPVLAKITPADLTEAYAARNRADRDFFLSNRELAVRRYNYLGSLAKAAKLKMLEWIQPLLQTGWQKALRRRPHKKLGKIFLSKG